METICHCPGQYPIADWWENSNGKEVIDGRTNFMARHQGRDIIVLQYPGLSVTFMDPKTLVIEEPKNWDGYLQVNLPSTDLDHIVAMACNLDEVDDADLIREITGAAQQVISSDSAETLRAIYSRGPLYDGDVPSKVQRDELLAIGVINKCVVNGEDGYQSCNYLGRDVVRVLSLKGS